MGGTLEMIRSPLDFRAFQAGSRSRMHPLLVVRFRPNDLDRTRFGISTGRRLGTAVVRNRVRRRLKAGLQSLVDRIERGYDVLIVARPPAAAATQAELARATEQLLRAGRLIDRVSTP
jgi:ribonuclease P protein component